MAEARVLDVEGEKGAKGGNENVENDPICETNYIDRIASITREQLSTDLAKMLALTNFMKFEIEIVKARFNGIALRLPF